MKLKDVAMTSETDIQRSRWGRKRPYVLSSWGFVGMFLPYHVMLHDGKRIFLALTCVT